MTKAYYVAEQDYYAPKDKNGKYKEYAQPGEAFGDMMEVFKTLTPSILYLMVYRGHLLEKMHLQPMLVKRFYSLRQKRTEIPAYT